MILFENIDLRFVILVFPLHGLNLCFVILFCHFSDLDLFECCFSLKYCFVFSRCDLCFARVLLISDVLKVMIPFENIRTNSHKSSFKC